MIRMRLHHRLRIRHPPPHDGAIQLLPHVQVVRRMPPIRRPDEARLRAQRVRVVGGERSGAVGTRKILPRMQGRKLDGQLVVDAVGRQPGRGDDVEVAASGPGFGRRAAARQGRKLLRPGQLARGEGLAVGGEDLVVQAGGRGRCQGPGEPHSRQRQAGLEQVFPWP